MKKQEGLRPFNNLCFLNNSYCLTSVVPIPLVLLPLWPPSFCTVDDASSIYPINVGFFFPHCFVRFSFNSHSICYTLKDYRLLLLQEMYHKNSSFSWHPDLNVQNTYSKFSLEYLIGIFIPFPILNSLH